LKKAILLWIFSRISGNNETGGKDCQKKCFQHARVEKVEKSTRGAGVGRWRNCGKKCVVKKPSFSRKIRLTVCPFHAKLKVPLEGNALAAGKQHLEK